MTDYGPAQALLLDKNGILWIGSPTGLFWVDTNLQDLSQVTYTEVHGIIGASVNAEALDPIGQLWVGTEFGVSVVGRDKYTIVREYTTSEGRSPSPLLEDAITAVTVDPASGDVYFGTEDGISVVETAFRNFQEKLGDIVVAPQPFLVGKDANASHSVATLDASPISK